MLSAKVHRRYDNEDGVFIIPDEEIHMFDVECDRAGSDLISWIDIRTKYAKYRV